MFLLLLSPFILIPSIWCESEYVFSNIDGKSRRVYAKEGDDVRLLCRIRSNKFDSIEIPDSKIIWCKNEMCVFYTLDREIDPFLNDKKFSLIGNRSEHEYDLHIRNVNQNDNANFTCKMLTDRTHDSEQQRTIELIIIPKLNEINFMIKNQKFIDRSSFNRLLINEKIENENNDGKKSIIHLNENELIEMSCLTQYELLSNIDLSIILELEENNRIELSSALSKYNESSDDLLLNYRMQLLDKNLDIHLENVFIQRLHNNNNNNNIIFKMLIKTHRQIKKISCSAITFFSSAQLTLTHDKTINRIGKNEIGYVDELIENRQPFFQQNSEYRLSSNQIELAVQYEPKVENLRLIVANENVWQFFCEFDINFKFSDKPNYIIYWRWMTIELNKKTGKIFNSWHNFESIWHHLQLPNPSKFSRKSIGYQISCGVKNQIGSHFFPITEFTIDSVKRNLHSTYNQLPSMSMGNLSYFREIYVDKYSKTSINCVNNIQSYELSQDFIKMTNLDKTHQKLNVFDKNQFKLIHLNPEAITGNTLWKFNDNSNNLMNYIQNKEEKKNDIKLKETTSNLNISFIDGNQYGIYSCASDVPIKNDMNEINQSPFVQYIHILETERPSVILTDVSDKLMEPFDGNGWNPKPKLILECRIKNWDIEKFISTFNWVRNGVIIDEINENLYYGEKSLEEMKLSEDDDGNLSKNIFRNIYRLKKLRIVKEIVKDEENELKSIFVSRIYFYHLSLTHDLNKEFACRLSNGLGVTEAYQKIERKHIHNEDVNIKESFFNYYHDQFNEYSFDDSTSDNLILKNKLPSQKFIALKNLMYKKRESNKILSNHLFSDHQYQTTTTDGKANDEYLTNIIISCTTILLIIILVTVTVSLTCCRRKCKLFNKKLTKSPQTQSKLNNHSKKKTSQNFTESESVYSVEKDVMSSNNRRINRSSLSYYDNAHLPFNELKNQKKKLDESSSSSSTSSQVTNQVDINSNTTDTTTPPLSHQYSPYQQQNYQKFIRNTKPNFHMMRSSPSMQHSSTMTRVKFASPHFQFPPQPPQSHQTQFPQPQTYSTLNRFTNRNIPNNNHQEYEPNSECKLTSWSVNNFRNIQSGKSSYPDDYSTEKQAKPVPPLFISPPSLIINKNTAISNENHLLTISSSNRHDEDDDWKTPSSNSSELSQIHSPNEQQYINTLRQTSTLVNKDYIDNDRLLIHEKLKDLMNQTENDSYAIPQRNMPPPPQSLLSNSNINQI
ncbi:hypothetical protein SNEBB_003538 [Seison nebaliae]|nr:hypothetical protein SNEBB_003538 [Seison nebaliae]